MPDNVGTVKIGKKDSNVDLSGLTPNKVKYLRIYADNKRANLGFLSDYPNVETLFINGDLANVDGISELKRLKRLVLRIPAEIDLSEVHIPELKKLSVYKQINPGISNLLTENIEYLELMEMRRLTDLSFVEKASNLKKLYLMSLPSVEKLLDFGKLPNLFALKLYELHKLNDIESLTRSNIKYLDLALVADKLTGTKIADVLFRMEHLEQADIILDRSSDKRYNVLKKRLEKLGKPQLLTTYFDMNMWLNL